MTHNEHVGGVAASRAMPFRGQVSARPVAHRVAQAGAALLARLEPISKSFEEHHDRGKLHEAEKVRSVVLPANH